MKFRAYDSKHKEMFEETFVVTEDGEVMVIEQKYSTAPLEYVVVNHLVLMQSTGLFDKKGVEIFEGDIIKNGQDDVMCMKKHDTLGFYVERKSRVDFVADCAVLEKFEAMAEEIADSIEVIGNIYENPELNQN